MTGLLPPELLTVEDYLSMETDSLVKHEYLGGAVHAMAGATVGHNRIAGNFLVEMGRQLKGKPCEPFNSDTKVRISLPNHVRFYYPDAMVVCDSNPQSDLFQDRPVIIAEVLSPSTRRVDLCEKRDAYLTIPSLRVLLLIDSGEPAVTLYRRSGGSDAFETEYHAGLSTTIPLPEIDAVLSLADLYERVDFSAEPADDAGVSA